MTRTLGKLFVVGFLGLALLVLLGGGSCRVRIASHPSEAATSAAERPAHFRATPEILRLRDDLRKLDAEARCKSNKSRLLSGECD